MEKDSKIYVAGHRGMVGSAIVRELKRQGYENILTRTHAELDLTRQTDVEKFFSEEKPEYVFLAAAKVGGIGANSVSPADFMYENILIEMNVIHAAWKNSCRKLEFLGSSCIYPKFAQSRAVAPTSHARQIFYFSLMKATNKSGQHMRARRVIIIVRAVKIRRHDRNKIRAVLPIEIFAILKPRNFSQRISLIGRLKRGSQQAIFRHWLRREFWVNARRA